VSEKTKNQLLYDKAMRAIRELWEDHSVDLQQAADNLHALQDEITDLINATESDIARQEGLTP
jgi:hypothetical protein